MSNSGMFGTRRSSPARSRGAPRHVFVANPRCGSAPRSGTEDLDQLTVESEGADRLSNGRRILSAAATDGGTRLGADRKGVPRSILVRGKTVRNPATVRLDRGPAACGPVGFRRGPKGGDHDERGSSDPVLGARQQPGVPPLAGRQRLAASPASGARGDRADSRPVRPARRPRLAEAGKRRPDHPGDTGAALPGRRDDDIAGHPRPREAGCGRPGGPPPATAGPRH